ncbi:insulinase family protein [Kitasatospora sp. NPDC057936]|uniref:insulinase family protein n=1 Tax=Kitasatospora sp. NPDC057936 TaxID=3346283 RepID=UPI0036DCB079
MVSGKHPAGGTQIREGGVHAVDLPSAKHVAIGLAIPVGFADDPPEAPGATHLSEHVALALAPFVSVAVPTVTATTHCHSTTFTTEVLPGELAATLQLFAAIAQPPLQHLQGMVDQEKPVVGLELTMNHTTTGRIAAFVADRILPATGFGRAHEAGPEEISRLTAEQINHHLTDHYRRDTAALVLAGPLSTTDLTLATRHFPVGTAPVPRPARATSPDAALATAISPTHWGVAQRASPYQADGPAWLSDLEDALIRPGGPADRLARSQAASTLGALAARCPHGNLLISAYTHDLTHKTPAQAAEELAGALRRTDPASYLPQTLQHAARSHQARRGLLALPWHARNALIAEATGTGPVWNSWEHEFDKVAATAIAASALTHSEAWNSTTAPLTA